MSHEKEEQSKYSTGQGIVIRCWFITKHKMTCAIDCMSRICMYILKQSHLNAIEGFQLACS